MMKLLNEQVVEKYFEAYAKHDMNAIKEVMHEDVTWYFIGKHPLAGVKNGVEEVVAFFDRMGEIMGKAKMMMDKLITASNDNYFIECQHSSAVREDGNNLDHFSCVLWTIKDGKIIEGRHFFADPQAVDKYFMAVTATPII
jgi:uncharacterized protein